MPELQLSIGVNGVPLYYPVLMDTTGKGQAFLDAFVAQADMSPFAKDVAPSGAFLPREYRWANAGAANPQAPEIPLKINRIVFPTGANRVGVGCFLVNSSDTIGNGQQQVTIYYGDGQTLTGWWVAYSRQITPGLTLIVVCDDRYRMRGTVTSGVMFETETWDELISTLASSLGTTITTDACDYELPDYYELARLGLPALEVLEIVATSRGQRAVYGINGTFHLTSVDTARNAIHSRKVVGQGAQDQDLIVGNQTRGMLPEGVKVIFQGAQSGAFHAPSYRAYEQVWSTQAFLFGDKDAISSNLTLSWGTGNSHAIHCTYPAETSVGLDWENPDNVTDLKRLSCRITRDAVQWAQLTYDYTVPGVDSSQPTGSDDCIVWDLGTRVVAFTATGDDVLPRPDGHDGKEYVVTTRFISRRANDLPRVVWAGNGKMRYAQAGLHRVKITGDVGDNTPCVLWDREFDSPSEDARPISVSNTIEDTSYPMAWVAGPMPDNDRFEFVTPPSSIAPTTTTSTTTAKECSGRCRWIWSGEIWERDEQDAESNTCAERTTSTSSTTAPGTTTTTTSTSSTTCKPTDPCCRLLAADATTTTTTSTSTTSTSSTTAAMPCRCQYPTFCLEIGANIGDCTWTGCADTEPTPPIACASTSTTTAGGATTTSTTTAGCPSQCQCTEGCEWIALPNGFAGWNWYKSSNGCGPKCPCGVPTDAVEPCGQAFTDCVPSMPQPCDGYCEYWWIPSLQEWHLFYSYGCTGGVNCGCPKPSYDGENCAPERVKCSELGGTTTPDECAGCYPTTTSTTTSGCGYCTWGCGPGNAWVLESSDCLGNCLCSLPPPRSCSGDCDKAKTPCANGPTTTSTTTAPATTTSTSTTTIAPCTCIWQADAFLDWVRLSACSQGVGCDHCPPPDYLGEPAPTYVGQRYVAACSATAPTTTTTTSTSTTTAGCAGTAFYRWSLDGGGYYSWNWTSGSCPQAIGIEGCVAMPHWDGAAGTSPLDTENVACTYHAEGTATYRSSGAGQPWVLYSNYCNGGYSPQPPVGASTEKRKMSTWCA